jgi:hypothetical protein
MLDRIRVPFLVLAILLALALVAAEAGLPGYQEPLARLFALLPSSTQVQAAGDIGDFFPAEMSALVQGKVDEVKESGGRVQTFGYGLRYLWLVDGLLLFSLLLIGLGVYLPPAWQARLQGGLTLIFALFVIISAVALIVTALGAVILMISLLLAFPFGTIVYMIKWGHFDYRGAAAILALFFTLKLFIAGALVLAHQRFLQNLGLVILLIVSLVANLVISFLHGLVPFFLVSISDAIAGIVVGIIGLILAVLLLVSAILSIIAAFRA